MICQQRAPADAQDKDGSQSIEDKPGQANLTTEQIDCHAEDGQGTQRCHLNDVIRPGQAFDRMNFARRIELATSLVIRQSTAPPAA